MQLLNELTDTVSKEFRFQCAPKSEFNICMKLQGSYDECNKLRFAA